MIFDVVSVAGIEKSMALNTVLPVHTVLECSEKL